MTEPDVPETPASAYDPADLPPFAEVVGALADIDDATDTDDGTMDVEEIRLGLAIELEVRDADGPRPRVTGSTPTQWTQTTIMPVFHRLSVRITRGTDA